jgi:Glycogen debranching enzyme, glucanotransferase domain
MRGPFTILSGLLPSPIMDGSGRTIRLKILLGPKAVHIFGVRSLYGVIVLSCAMAAARYVLLDPLTYPLQEDNPWLWKHITKYTKLMAQLFHGFRIDNCHSTPLHVGAYLLDVARQVRPDIYICAELFTGSQEMDVVFVSHLGISSLIREAMQAWDPQELSR